MESYKKFIKRKDEEFRKGKLIKVKDIGKQANHLWQREAWTFMPQHNLNEKIFIIERLRRVEIEGKATRPKTAKIGDIEYRLGYYIIGKNGRAKGRCENKGVRATQLTKILG